MGCSVISEVPRSLSTLWNLFFWPWMAQIYTLKAVVGGTKRTEGSVQKHLLLHLPLWSLTSGLVEQKHNAEELGKRQSGAALLQTALHAGEGQCMRQTVWGYSLLYNQVSTKHLRGLFFFVFEFICNFHHSSVLCAIWMLRRALLGGTGIMGKGFLSGSMHTLK